MKPTPFPLVVFGRPVPKSYGLTEGRMYPKNKVQKQEEKIGFLFEKEYGKVLSLDNFELWARFIVPDKRRGDLKNYVYLVEDALSGVAYKDDKQIIDHDTDIRLKRDSDGVTLISLRPQLDLENLTYTNDLPEPVKEQAKNKG